MTSIWRTIDTCDLDGDIDKIKSMLDLAQMKKTITQRHGLEKLHRAILIGTKTYLEHSGGQASSPMMAVDGYDIDECTEATKDLIDRGLFETFGTEGAEYAFTATGLAIADILSKDVWK